MQTLKTEFISLEPQTVDHANEMFVVLSDPAIYEFEDEPPASLAWLATRYKKLESRKSPDQSEYWLNWIVRLPTGELIGYVQATVAPSKPATIAYELNSRFWGKGYAKAALTLMLSELKESYGAVEGNAVLKAKNFRSKALLDSLHFSLASEQARLSLELADDEILMERVL
jgi:[ribosomal protein S5]-alanine N-acetyltransferase